MSDKKSTTTDSSMQKAVGRRKTASARVRLFPGKGSVVVNDKALKDYFGTRDLQETVIAPLVAIGKEKEYDLSVKVAGGGLNGQAEAVRQGVARALSIWNPDFRPVLKAMGFLTRDSRAKERKKPGLKKARKRTQWRKR